MTGASVSLPWSWKVPEGVTMKSPGDIVTRSPSTAVKASWPSRISLSAEAVCLWLGAVSPGMISWMPA